MEYYKNGDCMMAKREALERRASEEYEPFSDGMEWLGYGTKMAELLDKLVREYKMPQYPDDVMECAVRPGESLREWLKYLTYIADEMSKENADEFCDRCGLRGQPQYYGTGMCGCPSVSECYYIYPIFRELITHPTEVVSKLRQQEKNRRGIKIEERSR